MSEFSAPMQAIRDPFSSTASLRRNFILTLAGNLAYAASQWGILVLIAKLGTPAMLGEFALGLAIAGPVFMLVSLQLRAVLATDAMNEFSFGHYLALRTLGAAIGMAIVVGCVWIVGLRGETAIVVVAIAAAKAVEALSDIVYGLWQKYERFDKIAIALSARGFCSLFLLAVVFYFTRSIVWSAFAMALCWAFWFLTYERHGAKRLLSRIGANERVWTRRNVSGMKPLIVLAWPVGLVMLLLSLNVNIPRYFIAHYLGEVSLGYFAAIAYIFIGGNTIIGAIGQSAVPRLSRSFHSDRAEFVRLLGRMISFAGAVGLLTMFAAIFFGSGILRVLYRADYRNFEALFIWLMGGAAFSYVASILGYGMTAARAFRPQVPLYLIVTISTAVACWFLIPRFKLEGSAYAILVGAGLSVAGGFFVIRQVLRRSSLAGTT